MGRNARRRAQLRDLDHPAGEPGEERDGNQLRCPDCGSEKVIQLPYGGGGFYLSGRSLSCVNCGWQAISRP